MNQRTQQAHLAMDPLTGIASLICLRESLETLVVRQPGVDLSVLQLGVDNFKVVNDMLGSVIGDLVLQQLVVRLQALLPKNAMLARKSGDEFLLVLLDSGAQKIRLWVKKILQELSRPFLLAGQTIYITVSIGISTYPKHSQMIDELLGFADFALSHIKERSENNYQFYTQYIGKKSHYTHLIQQDLHRAIDQQQLLLYYQPKICCRDERIIGVEALLRWQHPRLGLIAPDAFIPIAEKRGLIMTIGEWVLMQACMQAKIWQKTHHEAIVMAVNVSLRQVQRVHGRRLIDVIAQILKATALPPHLLELEITESTLVHEDKYVRKILQQIRELGVLISCDDFGAGYTSLRQLKRLPIDIIKIDRSLIKDVAHNMIDLSIIRAIVSIARQLKVQVVAEGVENEAQYLALKANGCDVVQGNYFAKASQIKRFKWL